MVKAGKVANEKVTSFLLFPPPAPFVFFCGGGIKNWKFSSWRTWVENYVLDTHVLSVNEGIDDSEGALGCVILTAFPLRYAERCQLQFNVVYISEGGKEIFVAVFVNDVNRAFW